MAKRKPLPAGVVRRGRKYYREDGREVNRYGYLTEPSEEEYEEERDRFRKKHPDLPEPQPMECLDLIITRQMAQQIIDGTLTVDYRADCQYYCDMLIDDDVWDYCQAHRDDEELDACLRIFYSDTRPVDTIHYHDFNNTWYLDVEVDYNDVCEAIKNYHDVMREEFESRFLADKVKWQKANPLAPIRTYFFFAIERVIAHNLNQ